MTNEELKAAMQKQEKIVFDGITYRCITSIIYKIIDGKIKVVAELMDMNKNSVTIALPERMEIWINTDLKK